MTKDRELCELIVLRALALVSSKNPVSFSRTKAELLQAAYELSQHRS